MKKITYQMMRLLIAASFMACCSAQAELRLPVCFSDNMVLQRGNATLWGWTTPGVKVKVTVSDNAGPITIAFGVAGSGSGAWQVSLHTASPLPNTTINVAAANESLSLINVAFGDVYLCRYKFMHSNRSIRSRVPFIQKQWAEQHGVPAR